MLPAHSVHSHANLKSKLLSDMPYAWNILKGKAQSMLNKSFPTRPNCMYILLSSYSSINWKFFTLALSTRPLKFRTNACTCSFHFGGLLKKNMMSFESLLSNFPCIVSVCTSVSGQKSSCPSRLTIGRRTFILLGPFDPSTLVSYYTTPYCYLRSSCFALFFGFSLLSKM